MRLFTYIPIALRGSLVLSALLLIAGCGGGKEESGNSGDEPGIEVLRPASGASRSEIADLVAAAELDEDRQKFIWDSEHMTFVIETHFGKPFIKDMVKGYMKGADSWAADEFNGQLFAEGWEKTINHDLILEQKRGTNHPKIEADWMQVAEKLKSTFASFETTRKVKFQLLGIANDSLDRLNWQAKAYVNIIGEKQGGRPLEYVGIHQIGIRIEDFSKAIEEIQGGHHVVSWEMESEVLREAEHYLMEEVTDQVGLSNVPIEDNWKLPFTRATEYRFQMAVDDFDLDGWLDILVVNGVNRPLLLKNEKGGFRDVAEEVGLGAYGKLGLQGVEKSPFTYLCGWIDYDNDGDRDLVVGHRLLRNDEGSQFVDVTAESGLTFDSEPMGFYPIDYDCDGDLDIYVLYQGEYLDHDADGKPLPWVGDNATGGLNVLWQNQGDGSFVDVTEAANAGGGNRHSFAATWMFYNEDHFPDVYIANDFGENVMLLNKGDGTFEDITKSTGSGDFATSMGVASDDLDNDGQDEIYVANMFSKMGRRIIAHVGEDDYPEGVFEQIKGSCAGNRLYSRTGSDGTFKDLSEDFGINGVGWAYAPAMVDVDQDGLLDLYATTGFLSFERGKPDG